MNEALLSSKKMDWCTPADFFADLDQEFYFDLDPAATAKSAKCARYFTPNDDGLKMDWGGSCVFCNPPYGRQIGDWVRKGYEESQKPGTVVVMLIPARTDTAYFHDYILHGKATEIRFLRGYGKGLWNDSSQYVYHACFYNHGRCDWKRDFAKSAF